MIAWSGEGPIVQNQVTSFEEFPWNFIGLNVTTQSGEADCFFYGKLHEGNPILTIQIA
jgi:hypothetical protein